MFYGLKFVEAITKLNFSIFWLILVLWSVLAAILQFLQSTVEKVSSDLRNWIPGASEVSSKSILFIPSSLLPLIISKAPPHFLFVHLWTGRPYQILQFRPIHFHGFTKTSFNTNISISPKNTPVYLFQTVLLKQSLLGHWICFFSMDYFGYTVSSSFLFLFRQVVLGFRVASSDLLIWVPKHRTKFISVLYSLWIVWIVLAILS